MMKKLIVLASLVLTILHPLKGQIEDVIVETYYISQADDIIDPFDAILVDRSVTYRVFIDLEEEVRIKELFADGEYPIQINSTKDFFNHPLGGSFGYQLGKSNLSKFSSTLPLDSWLTLAFASTGHFGMLKEYDPDTSVYKPGYLENDKEAMGVPLTTVDGLIASDSLASTYNIFSQELEYKPLGTLTDTSQYFTETSPILVQKGITGPTKENRILVAQLTTVGDISFILNLKLEVDGEEFIFVGKDTSEYRSDVIFSNLLSYPKKTGCTDPFYAQYDPTVVIHDQASCIDSIKLGCMDKEACNYDPVANFNVRELCCYPPDNCDDRDLEVVCPDWYAMYGSRGEIHFNVFPNPADDHMSVDILEVLKEDVRYSIYDLYGNLRIQGSFNGLRQIPLEIPVSSIDAGMYIIRLDTKELNGSHYFIKR